MSIITVQKGAICEEQHMDVIELSKTSGLAFANDNHDHRTSTLINQKTYVCQVCGLAFHQEELLKSHILVHSGAGANAYPADNSVPRFLRKIALNTSSATQMEQKPHTCKICGQGFMKKGKLKSHSMMHAKKKLNCEVNGGRFSPEDIMKSFSMTQFGEKPYICGICDHGFFHKDKLKSHLLKHTKEESHTCNICYRKFSQKVALKSHLFAHAQKKLYTCEICGYGFSSKKGLESHWLVHTEEKPYTCELCDCRFSRKQHLKSHLLAHAFEKPHGCGVCGQQFSQKDQLEFHLLAHNK